MLEIVASYHCMQYQEKLINQTWENDNKASFAPDFGLFGTNLGPKNVFWEFYLLLHVRHRCKLSLSGILCELLYANIVASYHCVIVCNQEASPSAFKNTGVVLVPCLHMEVRPYSYFRWCGYFWGPCVSFVTTSSHWGSQKLLQRLVSHELKAYLSIF